MPVRSTSAHASIPMCQPSRTISVSTIAAPLRGEHAEPVSPLFIVGKHVVAGTGGGKQNGVTGARRRSRGGHDFIEVRAEDLEGHVLGKVSLDHWCRFSVGDDFFHLASNSLCEWRVRLPLVPATQEED